MTSERERIIASLVATAYTRTLTSGDFAGLSADELALLQRKLVEECRATRSRR